MVINAQITALRKRPNKVKGKKDPTFPFTAPYKGDRQTSEGSSLAMATVIAAVPDHLAMAAMAWASPSPALALRGSIALPRSPSSRFPSSFASSNSRSRLRCCRAEGVAAANDELPPKLQEIVRVFQGVTEPRAKCEQLLRYASKLKPLDEEKKQPENKVEGCVSKVYIACELRAEEDGQRVYFEAESDVMLTKGLAGLLVEGLSGHTAEEVLKVTPEFVHMLGLKQSLTPSRSNGFLNMLKLIQKKTLQVSYSNSMASGNAAAVTVPITSINSQDDRSDSASPVSGKPAGN